MIHQLFVVSNFPKRDFIIWMHAALAYQNTMFSMNKITGVMDFNVNYETV